MKKCQNKKVAHFFKQNITLKEVLMFCYLMQWHAYVQFEEFLQQIQSKFFLPPLYVIAFWIFTLKVEKKNINKHCFCCGGFPILTERSEQLRLWNPSEMGDSCLWLEFCRLLLISLCTPSWASTLKASMANYKKK